MPSFGRNANAFTLHATQQLAAPLDQVFAFFADARNLQALTPDFLSFQILTPCEVEMRVGALIDYRIKLRIIPLRWRTLISAWEPPHRFVDEQLKGPYSLWRHEHRFEANAQGTLVTDDVEYRVLGGALVNKLIVQPDLRRIFQYRQEQLASRFK